MTTRVTLSGLALLALSFAAVCLVAPAQASFVMQGTDFLNTVGAQFDFGGPIGVVPLTGRPLPGWDGWTDTIVQRRDDADLTTGTDTIPIEIVALSLVSVAPINISGSFFDVFVHLDPFFPGESDGSMTIFGGGGGGTFDSFFDVFFTADFTEVGNPLNTFGVSDRLLFTSLPTLWQPTPPPGLPIYPGNYPNPNANLHQNPPQDYVDFYLRQPMTALTNGGFHTVQQPEPSTVAMLLIGLVPVALARRRRARA